MVKKLKQEPSSDDDERSLAYIVKQMKRGKTPLHDHLPGITTENLNLTHVRKLHASKPICENKLFWACQAKFKNVLDGER